MSNYIGQLGYSALPIAASQIVDWQNQRAHLSHKRIGNAAGLGWIGRNNLLVNDKYGCQFRLVTILSDMPLITDKPVNKDCGKCHKCIETCPAQAIKEEPEDFLHIQCFEKLKEFQKKGYVGQYICGVCIKACSGKNRKS
jgi:epoxyqueuosine reductase QueG